MLEYSKWILAFDPSLGLKVFAAFIYTDPVAAIAINPANILKHLEQSLLPEPSSSTGSGSSNGSGKAGKAGKAGKVGKGRGKAQALEDDQYHKSHPSTFNELCVCYLESLLIDLPRALASKQNKDRRGSNGSMGDRRGSAGKDSLDRRGGRRISILASRTLRLRVAQRNEQQTAMLQNRLRRITSDEALHNQLALYYLDAIDESSATSILTAASAASAMGGRAQNPAQPQPASTAKTISRESGKRGSLRRRLLSFLQTSRHYQAQAFLTKFQGTRLYEERAVLLQRAGRHEDALKIYVHDMGALDMATAYCDRVSNSSKSAGTG